jgi:hypothetical protein
LLKGGDFVCHFLASDFGGVGSDFDPFGVTTLTRSGRGSRSEVQDVVFVVAKMRGDV